MRMSFGPDDERAFLRARDRLLDRFAAWADARGVTGVAFMADTALDYKFGYADGALGRWDAADLEDYLLEWCPRKLTLDDEGVAGATDGVATFLRFLDDEGLLDGEGDHLEALEATLEWIAPRFPGAMRDPTRFGMAKTIASAIGAAGIALGDEAEVHRFLSGYRLPPEVDLPGALPPPSFAPVRLAPEDELLAAAARAPLVRRLRGLARWVGEDGRKLTGTGNLTVADVRRLAAELGLADADELATMRVRSSADIPDLAPLVELARHLRLVRVHGGRLRAVKRSRGVLEDPLRLCQRLTEAVTTALTGLSPWAVLDERLPGGTPQAAFELLETLYEPPEQAPDQAPDEPAEPATVGGFAEHLWDHHLLLPDQDEPEPGGPSRLLRVAVEVEVGLIVRLLEQAGLVELAAPGDPVARLGGIDRRTAVALTPLGIHQVNVLLRAAGADAPVVGDLAGADVAGLLDTVAHYDEAACRDELRVWCASRGERAAAELAAYLRTAVDFDRRMMAFTALDEAGPAAEAQVRALQEDRDLRPLADLWLVRHGLADQGGLDGDTAALLMAQTLGSVLDRDGPSGLVAHLQQLGPPGEQAELLAGLWRSATPRAAELLGVIGKAHPSRDVAKAARKAAFKLRSTSGR